MGAPGTSADQSASQIAVPAAIPATRNAETANVKEKHKCSKHLSLWNSWLSRGLTHLQTMRMTALILILIST
jgi:hypothetical protein